MRVLEKIDLIVQLKEKIAEAKAIDSSKAAQLQHLLDSIIASPKHIKSI